MPKLLFLLQFAYCASNIAVLAAAGHGQNAFHPRSEEDNGCDVLHALSLLRDLSATGDSFCTSLLHMRQDATKTVSDIIITTEACSVRTETKTAHETYTTTQVITAS